MSVGTIPALRSRCGILFIFIVAELKCVPLIYWTAAAVRVDAALFLSFPVQTVPAVIYVVVPRLAIRSHAYTSFRPRRDKKIARLPTHASLWVTDALCMINHIRICQFRTNSDSSIKRFLRKKTRKTSTVHRSVLHAQMGSIFPHFLTQNHLQNEFSPNFNSKKQDQNRINQDKKCQTESKDFI